ncbi:SUN domain-containing protein 1-like [Stegodyphus dumicola]|uniref:SUN domain-containing protein 1-like n=1 Tax=Stegodyphus dumicola TaxID=202533 RepID=UPI0015A91093|nr:SUN domain-containing protein 1-like [Stegodyphus dumicola]
MILNIHGIYFIFIVFVLYYLGMILEESNSVTSILRLLNSGFSTLVVYLSSILSTLSSFFINSRELIVETSNEESTCFSSFSGIYAMFPSFSGLYTIFPSGKLFNIFSDDSKTEEKPSHVSQHSFEFSDAQHLLSKEELKILITDILKEEKISSIRSEIKKLRLEFQPLAEDLKKLEKDLIQRHEIITTSKTVESLITEHKLNYDYLHTKLKNVEKKLEVLDTVKKGCDEKLNPAEILSLIESYLIAALKNISDSNTKGNFTYQFFTNWLNSNFVNQEKLSSEIKSEIEKLRGDYQDKMKSDIDITKTIETVIHKYVESLKTNLSLLHDSQGSSHLYGEMFSMDVIKKLVKEAIMLYDADKTGLVDYALESGGGSVLGTRCSETYVEKNGKFSIFGLPLWTSYNSPRTAIQPDVNPGQCWAFKGSQGFLVLELSARIYPTGFTLEHIPVSLSPSGSVDSAPKDFSVWGLASETDSKGILLGKYTYDDKGEPLQYFAVQNSDAGSFLHLELKIHSNHGNIEYTCLYRFRVHGNRVK